MCEYIIDIRRHAELSPEEYCEINAKNCKKVRIHVLNAFDGDQVEIKAFDATLVVILVMEMLLELNKLDQRFWKVSVDIQFVLIRKL